jgi:hypothetical protein
MFKGTLALCALILLAACGGSETGPSGFLSSSGGFDTQLDNAKGGSFSSDETGNGYSYEVGVLPDGSGFGANAALLPSIKLTQAPSSGSAAMIGEFHVKTLQNGVRTGGTLAGTSLDRTRPITMNVDFRHRTLSGAADGLAVSGRFNKNGELTGTATFSDMSGSMAGGVGATEAIGVFEGSGDTGVFAGGFIVDK